MEVKSSVYHENSHMKFLLVVTSVSLFSSIPAFMKPQTFTFVKMEIYSTVEAGGT
jgi:hypothetical protein